MGRKLFAIVFCCTFLLATSGSAFAGMDISTDVHNHAEELLEQTNQDIEVPIQGIMCDCGMNMVRTEYYKSPWRLIKEVECRFGRPNCRDAKEYREITQTWTCGDCGRNFTTCTREDSQTCLG